jgi:Arc/MetJ-type ribon-helix-helix transcriptional regulator
MWVYYKGHLARQEATLVVRIPTELMGAIDQLRSKRSRAQGTRVSRSEVVRLLLERALGKGSVRPQWLCLRQHLHSRRTGTSFSNPLMPL